MDFHLAELLCEHSVLYGHGGWHVRALLGCQVLSTSLTPNTPGTMYAGRDGSKRPQIWKGYMTSWDLPDLFKVAIESRNGELQKTQRRITPTSSNQSGAAAVSQSNAVHGGDFSTRCVEVMEYGTGRASRA